MSFEGRSLPIRSNSHERAAAHDYRTIGPKFPTVNFSQPRLRRRAPLGDTFDALSERDNTLVSGAVPREAGLEKAETRSLGVGAENLPINVEPQDACMFELEDTRMRDTDDESVEYAFEYPSGLPLYTIPNEDETPSLPVAQSIKGAENMNGKHEFEHEEIMPNKLDRVRSTSSSYPSEGIRSPIASLPSPDPTSFTRSFVSDLARFGTLPDSFRFCYSTTSIQNAPEPDLGKHKNKTSEEDGAILSDGEFDPMVPPSPQESDRIVESADNHDRASVMEASHKIIDYSEDKWPQFESSPTQHIDGVVSMPSASHHSGRVVSERTSKSHSETDLHIGSPSTAADTESRHSLELCPQRCSSREALVKGSTQAMATRTCQGKEASDEANHPGQIDEADEEMDPDHRSHSVKKKMVRKSKIKNWMKKVCRRTKVRFGLVPKHVVSDPAGPKVGKPDSVKQREASGMRRLKKQASIRIVRATKAMRKIRSSGRRGNRVTLLGATGLESRLALMNLSSADDHN